MLSDGDRNTTKTRVELLEVTNWSQNLRIADLDHERARLEDELNATKRRLTEMASLISVQDGEISLLRRSLETAAVHAQRLFDIAHEALLHEIESVEAELDAVRRSRAWRLKLALRALGNRLRGMG